MTHPADRERITEHARQRFEAAGLAFNGELITEYRAAWDNHITKAGPGPGHWLTVTEKGHTARARFPANTPAEFYALDETTYLRVVDELVEHAMTIPDWPRSMLDTGPTRSSE